jgi:hypothetical protein
VKAGWLAKGLVPRATHATNHTGTATRASGTKIMNGRANSMPKPII